MRVRTSRRGFGVDAVQFARFDQAVNDGGALATAIRAGE
jgi:hypothetical protein